ncbi:MAG: hypothetical protein R3E66_05025 [bacterium]
MRKFFALAFVFFSFGCATPMSTLQKARTTPQGRVDVYAGVGANVSSGFIGDLSDLGESAANKADDQIKNGEQPQLTNEDLENLIGTAVSYTLFGPTPVTEFGGRIGILDNWDAGIAYTSAGFKFETKFMFMSQTDGSAVDLSLGLAGLRQTYEPPVPGFLKDIFQLEEMTRTDIALTLLAGGENRLAFWYGGPKFVYSNLTLGFVEQISDATQNTVTVDDNMLMFGGVIGGGIGWRYVHFLLELNALYYVYSANILDVPVDLTGVDFYPAFGLRIQFY